VSPIITDAPRPAAETPATDNDEQFQLRWPDGELSTIANRIQSDYRSALADHNRRMNRWRVYYRRWRAAVDVPYQGEEAASNVPVPYVRWNIFTKWAKEMDALFGDDAEIEAVPVGPSDYKRDKKISRYMTWRVFNYMKLTNPFCAFVLRKLLFGRSVAYSPWLRDTYEVAGEDVVDYEGPAFEPLWPDDFIVPCEEVKCLHDFSYVIRKYRITPDQLLEGEEEGRYQGITENWDKIINMAQRGYQREFEGDEIKREQDLAEGLMYQRPTSAGESLLVLEWYGRWRPLKRGKKQAGEWDFKQREMRQREYVVRYLWDLHLIISIQDLADLYPTKKNKRPFVESSMIKDGSYWSPGMAELLCDLEDELRVNHNQATEAGQLAMIPPIGYRPASGFNPDTFKLEPGMAIPLDNPQTDLTQIKIAADVHIAQWKEQCVLAYGEKLTGMSDLQMGRQSDRPNAPRTAQQTVSLLEEGNVRISLDTKMLREDMSLVLSHFWDLEYMFAPPSVFFRVTEEDADGAFPVAQGGANLSVQERDGRYDFRLQFASSLYSREADKEKTLARYQLDLQNPIIMQSPQALWNITRQVHEALGDPDFASLVPKPPAPDVSMDPKDEWNALLQGETIHVRPTDDDKVHMTRHYADLQASEADQEHADPQAQAALIRHYQDHIQQLAQKRIQQAVVEQAVAAANDIAQRGRDLGRAIGGAQPLNLAHGLWNAGVSQPPGNPAASGPSIYSGHPEELHGNV
jgi:hypothetical protein